jgi:NAD(P)-dependent dehydrogenase (short-subunit alcohol dehydrogenase family)
MPGGCGITGSGTSIPDLFIDRSLSRAGRGQGGADDRRFVGHRPGHRADDGAAGANVIIVARGEEALLETTGDEIEAEGGRHTYTCDLADMAACERLIAQVHKDHGVVDILVNNAGPLDPALDRLVLRSLSRLRALHAAELFRLPEADHGLPAGHDGKRRGQVINISSIGVLTNAPRFSAYVASKAALDAFSRCARLNSTTRAYRFTTINMPLVRTPMIAPTKIYESVPTITPRMPPTWSSRR